MTIHIGRLKKRQQNKRRELILILIIFIFVLAITIIPLVALLFYFNIEIQIVGTIIAGVISSFVSAILFYLLFSAVVEEKQQEYSAINAAIVATEYALERLNLAPQYVYPSSDSSSNQFDLQFKKNFLNSSFYYFKGASAGFAAYRLTTSNTVRNSSLLSNKSVRFLLLNPEERGLITHLPHPKVSQLSRARMIINRGKITVLMFELSQNLGRERFRGKRDYCGF